MKETKKVKSLCFVIQQLVSRDLKRRYTRSYLGIFWSVLNPLLMMGTLSVIFTQVFKRNVDNYPLYYLSAYILWHFFSEATNASMSSMVDNRTLMTKVKVPKSIFPLTRVCSSAINFMYSLVAYFIMLVIFKADFSLRMFWFPVIFILFYIFTLGISYILSSLYVFFGDIKHLYSIFLTILMYFSAIFYPLSSLNETTQNIISKNPLYNFYACARNSMVYNVSLTCDQILRMVLWALGSYIVGRFVFKRLENKMMMYL